MTLTPELAHPCAFEDKYIHVQKNPAEAGFILIQNSPRKQGDIIQYDLLVRPVHCYASCSRVTTNTDVVSA